MNNNKNKYIFIGIVLLVAVGLIFYLTSSVIPKVLVTASRASTAAKISVKNSFLIGEKIMATANGVDKCVVDVFVTDAEGKGISGKQVQLNGLGTLNAVTNSSGKASFELVSTVAKQYDLMATVGGAQVGKTLTVTFR